MVVRSQRHPPPEGFIRVHANGVPIASCDTDIFAASRRDSDDVLRLWLSSIRPVYRRAIRGRGTLRMIARHVSRQAGRHE